MFIEKARKVHGDKYDYSKVDYINNRTPVIIICPKHGEFKQIPKTHLKGHGCKKCTLEWLSKRYISNKDEFIKKARKVHGDKYDYSKVEYNGNKKEICIICPEHGEFWQMPYCHLQGKGCNKCKESRLEKDVRILLENNKINYKYQCGNDILPFLDNLIIDFYLTDYNIAIECQGEQHFKPIKHFGGDEKFVKTIKRDNKKNLLCKNNNVTLLYYSNIDENYRFNIINNKKELLKTIYEEKNKNN